MMRLVVALATLGTAACTTGEPEPGDLTVAEAAAAAQAVDPLAALELALARADSIEDLLLPLPLLTPAQEAALRTASAAQQLVRARALSERVTDTVTMRRLIDEGRLVRLEDQTALWATRELEASVPWVSPHARALLVQIGERFQRRLGELGLPPFRVEVTSVLRTPESQARLRESNSNAAAGVSMHEFGTTLDIAYTGFGAPLEVAALAAGGATDAGSQAGGGSFEERIRGLALERIAARYSRELQAVLGEVLRQMQAEGLVMVTLERQQPVYHLTVARALAEGR